MNTYPITDITQHLPKVAPRVPPDTTKGQGNPSSLHSLAQGFTPISLHQMDAVALLNRIDTKFVMTEKELLSTLATLQPDYWMLSVHGQRLNHYRTLYFDTPDFDLYTLHVNERAERYKVRSREYTDSHVSYLEVKRKTRKDRTIKKRIPTAQPLAWITPEVEDWLNNVYPFNSQTLEPKLWNTFTRLTLVSKKLCERVTLDVDLTFYAADKLIRLEGIAIGEVKMDTCRQESPFLAQMRARGIRSRGFSKYAVGISMLYDQVKKNSMKPKILWVEKMMMKGFVSNERTW